MRTLLAGKAGRELGEAGWRGPARKEGIINRNENWRSRHHQGDGDDRDGYDPHFPNGHVHLSAGQHGHRALMFRLASFGMQQPVQCPELSPRQDKNEQAKQQPRHGLAARGGGS